MRLEVLEIQLAEVRLFAGQPRSYFDQQALRDLADSIREIGQVTPVLVRPLTDDLQHRYELIDGQRRLHACQMAGLECLRAVVREPANELEQYKLSLAANFGREPHSALEIVDAIGRLRSADPPATYQEISRLMGKSMAWTYRYVKLANLVPAVRAMLDPNLPDDQQLSVTAAGQVADLPATVQLDVAQQILAGGGSSRVATAIVERHNRHRLRSAPTPHDVVRRIGGQVGRMAEQLRLITEVSRAETLQAFAAYKSDRTFDLPAKLRSLIKSAEALLRIVEQRK